MKRKLAGALPLPPLPLLLLLISFSLAAPAAAVPIGDLHGNDANGVPAAPYTLGTPVTVSGIVTVPDSIFNLFSTAVHVQDATGGVYVFQSGGVFQYDFDLGDSVTVSGTIGQFQGITEVTNLTGVTIHTQGNPVPAALDLTCAEVAATFDPVTFREEHESILARIQEVSITGGSWPTTPGSGSALTISDGTGSVTLYIAQTSELNGTPAPPSVFDITGVIQQADITMPLDGEYRILPRYLSDIGGDGPQIINGPEVVDITPTSARIEWTTSIPATSAVDLGPTTGYGITFSDPAMVTAHSVLCDPIADASYWHFRVSSSDGQGTSYSPDGTFLTPPATDEALMVYFNKSIDPTYAGGKVAAGNVPLDEILIGYLDAAQYSVDAAMYSLSLPQVADALIAAHQRGVEVRVIKEFETSTFQYNRLLAAGIPGIDSHFGGNHASGGIHHNKFWVIDARDQSSTLDDWTITGSWNPTYQGTDDDAQNVVVIKDTEVAGAYTIEFDEMWGSSTMVPDPAASRMGTEKFNNTAHDFNVNGIPLDVRFSPSDGNENVMIFWIGEVADAQAYFSILFFNRQPIEQALRVKWDNVPGFEVRGVFDDGIDSSSMYHDMSGSGSDPWSPPADVHLLDLSPGFLHHKYMILDPGDAGSDPMVFTGSPNWSSSARNQNDENQLFIHDYDIARIYLQEFAERYHDAGGTGPLGQGTAVGGQAPAPARGTQPRLRNFPNPFNPQTTIELRLPETVARPRLTIVDAAGRAVRELRLGGGALAAGIHRVRWNGTDARGRALPSGVYFYRLEAAGGQLAGNRMVLVR